MPLNNDNMMVTEARRGIQSAFGAIAGEFNLTSYTTNGDHQDLRYIEYILNQCPGVESIGNVVTIGKKEFEVRAGQKDNLYTARPIGGRKSDVIVVLWKHSGSHWWQIGTPSMYLYETKQRKLDRDMRKYGLEMQHTGIN